MVIFAHYQNVFIDEMYIWTVYKNKLLGSGFNIRFW